MAGPTCSLALQTGLRDVCWWFVAMISLCPLERTLTHPAAACGITVWKNTRKAACQAVGDFTSLVLSLGGATWGISGGEQGPQAHSEGWDGAGWSLFTQQCVGSSYCRQAGLEMLSLIQGTRQTQPLGLSSRQWVPQSCCPSFTGPVHRPSELIPPGCFRHVQAHLLIRTRVTHRRTKS